MSTTIYQKVDEIKRPLRVGEKFLVPCIVRKEYEDLNRKYVEYITPVINHPHNDKENGQNEIHYHADFRFINHNFKLTRKGKKVGISFRSHSRHIFADNLRPELNIDGELVYILLPVISEHFLYNTESEQISNSKLKHNCIYKGKCPHRGYELSQVNAVNGVIQCPLHGLKFDEKTKQLLKD